MWGSVQFHSIQFSELPLFVLTVAMCGKFSTYTAYHICSVDDVWAPVRIRRLYASAVHVCVCVQPMVIVCRIFSRHALIGCDYRTVNFCFQREHTQIVRAFLFYFYTPKTGSKPNRHTTFFKNIFTTINPISVFILFLLFLQFDSIHTHEINIHNVIRSTHFDACTVREPPSLRVCVSVWIPKTAPVEHN